MALKSRSSLAHFLLRLAGLTGLMLLLTGLVLWLAIGLEAPGMIVVVVGGALLALGLIGEIPGTLDSVMSRRGAVGGTVILQIALAIVLLVGVNLFSFHHYQRCDWTRDHIFTLKKELRDQLAQLRGETSIVVFQRHTAFGQTADNRQDNYDAAAQRKIVEKVRDLAEQFQDFGPRFRVQLLDIQDDEFEDKLAQIQKETPLLAEAIEKAPDNSIFFHAKGLDGKSDKVQRFSFHDIYQLDKKASLEANDGRGNLVLNDQGVGPFARKILNIEEKKPRIGFAVIHEFLGVDGTEDFGMAGVKKSLEARGFECVDIILKQWPQGDAAVLTHDEHKHERLEIQLAALDVKIKRIDGDAKQYTEEQKEFKSLSLEELDKKYVLIKGPYAVTWGELESIRKRNPFLAHERIKSEEVRDYYLKDLKRTLDDLDTAREKEARLRDKVAEEKKSLNVDNLEEQRRITDLRAKFNRMLADCDLLVLPRLTLLDAAHRRGIPNEVHKLDVAQVDALKDFMKGGKPVFFCLGPANEPNDEGPAPTEDAVENLLASLGIQLPNQTILFNAEVEALENWREQVKFARPAEVPPAELEWRPGAGGLNLPGQGTTNARNDIRTSLALSARGFSKKYPGDLRVRNPRPVYLLGLHVPREAAVGAIAQADVAGGFGPLQAAALLMARSSKNIDEKAIFLMTSSETWNDDQPFPTEQRIPHLERPKADDPTKGTVQEKRAGPFPIAVALETRLPASWYEGKSAKETPALVRLAVLGNGGVFKAETLTPMKEKLLLDTTNWLLGRDDLLARANPEPWQFPRVDLQPYQKNMWTWGAALGLPMLFIYLGMIMWLVRRMR